MPPGERDAAKEDFFARREPELVKVVAKDLAEVRRALPDAKALAYVGLAHARWVREPYRSMRALFAAHGVQARGFQAVGGLDVEGKAGEFARVNRLQARDFATSDRTAVDDGFDGAIHLRQPLLNLEEIDGEGFCRVVSAGQAERSTLVLDTLEELIARWNEKQGIAEAVSTP